MPRHNECGLQLVVQSFLFEVLWLESLGCNIASVMGWLLLNQIQLSQIFVSYYSTVIASEKSSSLALPFPILCDTNACILSVNGIRFHMDSEELLLGILSAKRLSEYGKHSGEK